MNTSSGEPSTPASPLHNGAYRAQISLVDRFFSAFMGHILLGQLLGLGDIFGVRYPNAHAVVVAANIAGPVAGFTYGRLTPLIEPNPAYEYDKPGVWDSLSKALVAWGLWASLYYLVAWYTLPGREVLMPSWYLHSFEPSLPLAPAAVMIYMGVHPLSVLPYFGFPQRRQIKQYFQGQLIIVAMSVVSWVLIPLVYPRESLGPDEGSIGLWVLASMRRNDPPANCLPSTHCSMAMYSALGLTLVNRRWGAWAVTVALAICVSTLLTRQHYVIDVLTGLLLGCGVHVLVFRKKKGESNRERTLPTTSNRYLSH